MMNQKRLLICGATGFIGRNLAEYFAQDDSYKVYGTYFESAPLDNPQIEMMQIDLTNKEDVQKMMAIKPDILIQAAATTSGANDIINKPYYHVTDNAVMNSLIFRAAFEENVEHVLFFSCTVMYPSSDEPLKETDFDANAPMHKNYFHIGWTKVYIEKMCEFYSRISDTKYTAIRHSNMYGPHDKFDLKRSHVFGATMTKVLSANEGDTITVWGTGEAERDLLYITDLIDFVEKAMNKQESAYELVNVGCGHTVQVKALIQKIIQHSGKDIKIKHDLTKPTITTKLCLDSSKAKEIYGWQPSVSLDEGILNTMNWYKENINVAEVAV